MPAIFCTISFKINKSRLKMKTIYNCVNDLFHLANFFLLLFFFFSRSFSLLIFIFQSLIEPTNCNTAIWVRCPAQTPPNNGLSLRKTKRLAREHKRGRQIVMHLCRVVSTKQITTERLSFQLLRCFILSFVLFFSSSCPFQTLLLFFNFNHLHFSFIIL